MRRVVVLSPCRAALPRVSPRRRPDISLPPSCRTALALTRVSYRFLGKLGTMNRVNRIVRNLRKAQRAPKAAARDGHPLSHRVRRWVPHIRAFWLPIAINHLVVWALYAACALLLGFATGYSLVPTMIASMWMVTNAVPISIGDVELGFVPLLPAVIYIWVLARRTTLILGTSITVRGLRVFVALSLLIPLLLTGGAWLMLWDAAKVYDVQPPDIGVALLSTALLNAFAVSAGMNAKVWRALLLRKQLPTWPVDSFRLAARFLVWMAAAAAIALGIYVFRNWDGVARAYDITSSWLDVVGLSLLAIAYIPNLLIGAVAVLFGGEFHLGVSAVSLFGVSSTELPPLPILAAVPNQEIPGGAWWLLIPALVVVGAISHFLRGREYLEAPYALACGAGLAAALLAFCAAYFGSGTLGIYGDAGPVVWLTAAEAGAWMAVAAVSVVVVIGRGTRSVLEDIGQTLRPKQRTSAPAQAPAEPAEAPSAAEEAEAAVPAEDEQQDASAATVVTADAADTADTADTAEETEPADTAEPAEAADKPTEGVAQAARLDDEAWATRPGSHVIQPVIAAPAPDDVDPDGVTEVIPAIGEAPAVSTVEAESEPGPEDGVEAEESEKQKDPVGAESTESKDKKQ